MNPTELDYIHMGRIWGKSYKRLFDVKTKNMLMK